MICVELKATGNTVHKFLPSALLQRTFTLHKNEADRQRVTEAVVMNISMTAAASNH